MDPHVPVEIARLGETEETEFALVGFLAAVDAHVFGQRRRVGERLLAHAAPVRTLARVRPANHNMTTIRLLSIAMYTCMVIFI